MIGLKTDYAAVFCSVTTNFIFEMTNFNNIYKQLLVTILIVC